MTAQIAETIYFHGKRHALCAAPLEDYFALAGARPDFAPPHTACWRGYVGSWEFLDERLYLTDISGSTGDGTDVSLETVFPGFPKQVFAHWFSGTLRLPRGKLLDYVHMGYASVYEEDVLVDVEKGVIQQVRVRCNGRSNDPRAPDGYGVGALTTLRDP